MTGAVSLKDPDVLHGFLMFEERGHDMAKAAKSAGVGLDMLEQSLDLARAGKVPKREFVNGSSATVSAADAPPPAHNPNRVTELFPRDWQRQCIAAMMIEGGAGTKDLATIIERNMLVSTVGDRMGPLRIALRRAGMDFHTVDTNKPTVRYQIIGEHRTAMLAVMKRGWAAQ
jgi:hypothetical protein